MVSDPDYKKVYEEFWKQIIEKEGQFSMDAVMRELFDYKIVLDNVPKVYDHISGGKFSKPHYKAEAMIAAANEWRQEAVEQGIDDYLANQDPPNDP